MALGNGKDGKKSDTGKEAKKPLIKSDANQNRGSSGVIPEPTSPRSPGTGMKSAGSRESTTEEGKKPSTRRPWGRLASKRELLQAAGQSPPLKPRANGSAAKHVDLLKRNDSLTVPGGVTPHKGKESYEDPDSPVGEGSPTSRRSSGRSIGSQLSSVDFSKLQQAAVPHPEKEEKPKNAPRTSDSYIISAIPYLPQWVAIICLIMNIIIPGSGTILSGFSIFCCGKPRVQTKGDQNAETFCINVMVGFMQLFTITFMLVGWFWSFVWGIYMIILAVEMKKEEKEKREMELQTKALTALSSNLRPWSLVRS